MQVAGRRKLRDSEQGCGESKDWDSGSEQVASSSRLASSSSVEGLFCTIEGRGRV